jgi:hypothetical protein
MILNFKNEKKKGKRKKGKGKRKKEKGNFHNE